VSAAWLFSRIIEDSPRALAHTTMRVLVNRQKSTSVDLGAMPADGFDAAAKKFGTSARPGGSSPKQWMDYTPVVRASEETNQNKPGAVVSVVGRYCCKSLFRLTNEFFQDLPHAAT
jgi:hypothetical protein